MYTVIIVLIVLAAVLLTILVLAQNSKGGGLASSFASGNQIMGAPKTADFLEKATWTLIALIIGLSIIAVGISKGEQQPSEEKSAIEVQAAPAPEAGTTTELPAQGE